MLGSSGPGGRPALRGDSGPCPRACGVDKPSWATAVRVRGPTRSTRCPGRLGTGSEGPRCQPDVPGTWAWVRGPVGSTNCPAQFGPVSEGTRVRAALPGDSSLGPMARVFDQVSRANRTQIRWPTWSTSNPGDSGPCPTPRGVNLLSRANRARVRVPSVSTSCPRTLALGPESPRGRPAVPGHQGRVQGPVVMTGCPRGIRTVPEGQQGPPVVLGDSGPGLKAHGLDQLFQANLSWVRGLGGSTSCPGRLGHGSEGAQWSMSCPG